MKSAAQKGDVVYVNRFFYKHYGIYNNDESVIHFSADRGAEINPENAYIRETSLLEFLKGGNLQIDHSIKPVFPPEEIAHRALCLVSTNLGEYSLLFKNCEHFTNWCTTDELESKQVKKGVAIAGGVALTAAAVLFLKSQLDKKNQSGDNKNT
jgi:hypothetical protein